jgi:hypothetical protein
MNRKIIIAVVVAEACAMTGCSVVPSTTQRAVTTGAGALAGGGLGYVLGHKNPAIAVAGAGLGALATGLALGPDPDVVQASYDDGYVQGQADAIKRQYFLRQALESRPPTEEAEQGKSVQYVVPGPTITADGRRLEPHTVTIDVTE